jgi:hypothetical protein
MEKIIKQLLLVMVLRVPIMLLLRIVSDTFMSWYIAGVVHVIICIMVIIWTNE